MEPCQGPRAVTSAPRFSVPALACDCHSHILGPTDRYPYVPNRSFTPPDASPASYLAMLGALGVERMVVVQPSVYGSDNHRTADAVGELGVHRARGVAMVGENVTTAELKALDDAGIRATRFITTAGGGPSLDNLPGVARKIADFGWHIEMYVPLDTWPKVLPVIETLPVSVVFDHMGGPKADVAADDPLMVEILRLLNTGKHWVKLCGYRNSQTGHPYADVANLARRFVSAVPDRCVWGTDWPHTSIKGYMPDDGDLMNLLEDWAPDADIRHKILVDNPARLYRFS
jgi:predicted TIM-barrel fold metal-dependent hydrolase